MAQNDLANPIGRPLDRVDGPLKVTGRAKYAFEYAAQGEAAYGFIVSAVIGKGRVAGVDVRDAERAPGVLLVLTQDNAPPQTPWGPVDLPDRFARAEPALDTDEVRYFGFPVAFVVAESFEQARAAAALVRLRYTTEPAEYDLRAAGPGAEIPGKIDGGAAPDTAVGDFESAFAAALVKIDLAYTTPYQHSAPMEPHASMAFWEGGRRAPAKVLRERSTFRPRMCASSPAISAAASATNCRITSTQRWRRSARACCAGR
ncbi:MAG: xanthine dehydrogenase family protein molybdopterin-binding subunit [Alphaproteobacteria bacterium]|nr:MAG: xanthine dehydrogenase family protein molybdopterin-binding subunit [Alphaproteobacteria bacterium]